MIGLLIGQVTAPKGKKWVSNGKSRFGGEYRHWLIDEDEYNKMLRNMVRREEEYETD